MSAPAVFTATKIYDAVVGDDRYQKSLPEQTDFGHKAFNHTFARKLIDCSNSTAKTHLDQLADEGILESTASKNRRRQGKRIFYRFVPGLKPPFGVRNPFSSLPTVDEIAADCS
ncbi:MAG: hypothetical protein ABGZ53_14785, partial [Fuerstiella sp.]